MPVDDIFSSPGNAFPGLLCYPVGMQPSDTPALKSPWYAEVTRYQWLVLIIASAGWIFDVFEGQLFAITGKQMLGELLHGSESDVKRWNDQMFSVFLLGGTLGGIMFGALADRYGRKPIMMLTIFCYSIFSGLTAFATDVWHVAVLRFLVAMGVGGEWAVAAALVAEVFPAKARAHASGIFHASSVLGTWLATFAGLVVASNWRTAYLVSVIPALLVLWVRAGVREPEHPSNSTNQEAPPSSRLGELLGTARWRKSAILGALLATVGLGSFWGVTVAGQALAQKMLISNGVEEKIANEKSKFAYGFVETAGGGLGLLCFGPLAVRIGRRGAFAFFQAGALIVVPVVCFLPQTYEQLLWLLPIFGFFTLGIHAGFAVYFPELFPDRLRATGTGFCFNGGRLLSAAVLWLSGEIKSLPGMDLRWAVTLLGSLFLIGLVLLPFLPETKDRPLPE